MFYTNRTTPIIAHSSIMEWDMKSANTSILREYNLVSPRKLDKIDALDGELRKVKVGLLQQRTKGLAKAMEEAFNDIVKRFIDENGLVADDIISIKRDAVFIRAKTPKIQTIGQYCHFRPKGEYVAFLLLNGYEFFMKSDGTFDIKGISDELIPQHQNGILKFIRDFLMDFEYDMDGLHQYCKDFVDAYKKKELPLDYYRELNGSSCFRLISKMGEFTSDTISEAMLNRLSILYNYENIVIPLIQYLF